MKKRELKKIQERIGYIYDLLDGEKKVAAIKSTDEFTNLQTRISEECVSVRKLIREKEGMEKNPSNFIELTKLKGQVKGKLIDLDDYLHQMENINKDKATMKISENQRQQREDIIEKLRNIINNLKYANDPNSIDKDELQPLTTNRIALKDLKDWGQGREQTWAPEATEQDMMDIDKWRARDQKMDDKLADINTLLEDLNERNKVLTAEIEKRDVLMVDTNKETVKVTKVMEAENHKLAKVLKSYRSPQKLCLDLCLILLLLGLIAVIIMLIKNGK